MGTSGMIKKFMAIFLVMCLSGCATITRVITPQNIITADVVLKGIQAVYGTICAIAVQKPDSTVMEVLTKTDKSLNALGQIVIDNQVPAEMSVAQAIYLGMEALVEITNIIAE